VCHTFKNNATALDVAKVHSQEEVCELLTPHTHTHTLTHAFLQILRNVVNIASTTIATLFNQLDRRFKSKDEKELLRDDSVRSTGKVCVCVCEGKVRRQTVKKALSYLGWDLNP